MNNVEIILTKHAEKRMHERAGLNRKAAKRLATRAVECGITVEQTKGCLHRFLAQKERSTTDKMFVRIYGEMAYIFRDLNERKLLITAYQVPAGVRRQAVHCQARKRATA